MTSPPPLVIGRYVLYDVIATGGMATVHFGRMTGPAGFARTVAIKRLHPLFAKDPEFVSMFLDEARLAARLRHLHVVPTLDIVAHEGELLLVMEYVQGVALSQLVRAAAEKKEEISPAIAAGVLGGALLGLHAVHEAKSDHGMPLDVVHRDVSPQNILVGVDGAARMADFGIAKAVGRLQTTREGQIKGKSGYMAPEQIRGRAVDRRTDVYAAAVVLWELLTGERLFAADTPMGAMNQVLEKTIPKPSEVRASVPRGLDAVVLCGLARAPADRYPTARDFALALEAEIPAESPRRIGEWVEHTVDKVLASRAERIAEIESSTSGASVEGVVQEGTPPASPRRPTARELGLAALLLAAVALGSFLAVRGTRTHATPSAASGESASADPSATPGVAGPVPSGAASSVPVAAAPDAHPTKKPRRSWPARPPPTPRGPSCNPPYTIGADGTRRWKDGC